VNKQTGFAIVAAMFLLIIVGLLGKYLVNISGVHHKTTILSLQSARAYHAAKSGIEWGIVNACNSGSYSINNFDITITAASDAGNPYDENLVDASGGAIPINICKINSKAEYGTYGTADYIARTVEVTINE